MNNTTEPTNKKEFRLSNFEPAVNEGTNRFLILNAESDTISTKNGDREVLKLDVELSDVENPTKTMTLKNHMLFIDFTIRSRFHLFSQAVIRGLNVTTFTPVDLIGKKGSVSLSYYRPEGSNRTFDRLNDWLFDFPREQVNEQLQAYMGEDNFELTDEDIDFGGADE